MIEELRNTPVRKLIHALERDGCLYRRAKGSQPVYRHPDGRRVVVHYHHGGDTLPIGTLRQNLEATRWSEEDLGQCSAKTSSAFPMQW
jgi:predicted RNA binding protein YcfA (HicA-like mRNA interferase family)